MNQNKKAIFTIGTAANMLSLHPRTLRIYEQEGLVNPVRKGAWRYYSMNDINWITCLRQMIHQHGINTTSIKKLLQHTSCWSIVDCSSEKRGICSAYAACPVARKGVVGIDA